ncbi:MAG: NAD-dependent epimerase/dehydratase family protein [Bdellovibrionales bacterium]
MKALVTGATGFLGGWLCKELIHRGYEVRILRRQNSDLSDIEDLKLEHYIGDVTDRGSVFEAVMGMDIVFHLAGVIAYEPEKRNLMEKVNVGGTQNVVDACLKNKTAKLLHLSSVVAIGASFSAGVMTEESDFNLNHLNLGYFYTKRQAEEIVMAAVVNDSLPAYIVNPSTIYGAGDAKKGSRKTQLKVAKAKFPLYPVGGVNVVAVEDVIQGIFLALEKGKPGRRYILSGENLMIRDLFIMIAEEAGVEAPKIPLHPPVIKMIGRIGDLVDRFGLKAPIKYENALVASMYHWFDNKRARVELGFQPKKARKAIANSVKWIKENGLLND